MALARLVGINHVALEVGDLDAALALYGRLFAFELRGRHGRIAFIDLGDQFLAVAAGRSQEPDGARHFGLVVDDLAAVSAALAAEGLEARANASGSIDFSDPWGNHFQVVGYPDVQFERTEAVKRRLGIADLQKSSRAQRELADRGLA